MTRRSVPLMEVSLEWSEGLQVLLKMIYRKYHLDEKPFFHDLECSHNLLNYERHDLRLTCFVQSLGKYKMQCEQLT